MIEFMSVLQTLQGRLSVYKPIPDNTKVTAGSGDNSEF